MNKKTVYLCRHLQRIDQRLGKIKKLDSLLIRWRLLFFLLCFIFVLLSIFHSPLRNAWFFLTFVFLGGFVVLVIYHSGLKKKELRWGIYRTIKELNLDRGQLDWGRIPQKEYTVFADHPYAYDLDIIGKKSLMQLLDTTVSSRGSKFLLDWLLYPLMDLDELTKRQKLVTELKKRSLFRDRLALEALYVSEREINGQKILARLQTSLPSWIPKLSIWEIILLVAVGLFLGGWYWFSLPPFWWGIFYFIYILIFFLSLPYLSPVFHRSISLQLELKKLQAIFSHLEKSISSKAPELKKCCAVFQNKANRPSSYLRKISRVCDALSIQANGLVHLGVNLFFPWDFLFVCYWEKVRGQMIEALPIWLECLGKVEAACALANFADNNRHFTFPLITNGPADIGLTAKDLSHPLIPTKERKLNHFELKGLGTLALITGSNMSGKSTFLKTVGINLCLAQAGGVVCSSFFQSSWFRLYSCIRIDDSLTEGLSYFYAEVKRLMKIFQAAEDNHASPVFALVDEIFKGTNNRERIIGSTYYLRSLRKKNLLGLITTHDLEVTHISKEGKNIHNYHFQETIENRKMKFDYRLRPGICPTTNALQILRLEGMPIPDSEDK